MIAVGNRHVNGHRRMRRPGASSGTMRWRSAWENKGQCDDGVGLSLTERESIPSDVQPFPSPLPFSVHAFSLPLVLTYSPTHGDFPWPPSSGLVNLPGKPAYIYSNLAWIGSSHQWRNNSSAGAVTQGTWTHTHHMEIGDLSFSPSSHQIQSTLESVTNLSPAAA